MSALRRSTPVVLFNRRLVHAFTLVELLVVIGIIALLVSILLPAINKARRSSQAAACLSNARQLVIATLMYANENRQTLPDATFDNNGSYSPKGAGRKEWEPGVSFGGTTTYVRPFVGSLIKKYIGGKTDVFRCPAAPADEQGANSQVVSGTDPWSGYSANDKFIANLYYMDSKRYFNSIGGTSGGGGTSSTKFHLNDWMVRNVSGLRIGQVKTLRKDSPSKIVLFLDLKSYYHTPWNKDVYDINFNGSAQTNNIKGKYSASFAYLDGHAEARYYGNLSEYLGQLHAPIIQNWFGKNWEATFPTEYNTFYYNNTRYENGVEKP